MGNNNGSGLKTILILVLLGIAGWYLWTNGYIKLPDPQTPTPVVPVVVPAVVPTPALTQPEYIPTPTAVWFDATAVPSEAGADPEVIIDVIQKTMQEFEDCLRKQMSDPMINYQCELYKDALNNLKAIAIESGGQQ